MKSITKLTIKSVFGISALLLATGCGSDNRGYLTGVQNRKPVFQEDPFGMVYVPLGSYHMGPGDQDVPNAQTAHSKMVSIPAFYMDETEITNNEYREFVYWVRDSIARLKAGESDATFKVETDKQGNQLDKSHINWKKKLNYEDPNLKDALGDMYFQGEEAMYGKEIDIRKLNYWYKYVDLVAASRDSSRMLAKNRDRYQIKEDTVNVYPDTLVWIRDYTYSFNDPMTENYFAHPSYDNYPVVGITWKQANAFCHWRTKMRNDYLASRRGGKDNSYRLPTEAEWEYAARGGAESNPYPWGGPYVRNSQGCFLANFKPMRGVYADDGGLYTVPASSYNPNGYGLYCMAGNVAEWTSTVFDPSTYNFAHDLSPDHRYKAKNDDPIAKKRKVIRGGSWKDVAYYLQVGTRDSEFQDTTKSYLGFRCVVTANPRGKR